MIGYILKRLLSGVLVLIAVALITFFLVHHIPGDPVSQVTGEYSLESTGSREEIKIREAQYRQTAALLGYDKPLFYFSIAPRAYPDTLYKILPYTRRQHAKQLIRSFGNWQAVSRFLTDVRRWRQQLLASNADAPGRTRHMQLANQLALTTDRQQLEALLIQLQQKGRSDTALRAVSDRLWADWEQMKQGRRAGLWLPKITIHGWDNQFHYWLSSFVRGNAGISLVDQKPVWHKVKKHFLATLWINIPALLLSIVAGIFWGKWLARRDARRPTNRFELLTYLWLAIPSFWLATMLIMFFTSPDYGAWTNLFPASGLGTWSARAPLYQKIQIRLAHLILPVLTLSLPAASFIALQVRRAINSEMSKDYIKVALLKGLSIRRVLNRHAMRNALFPVLTIFGTVLPGLFAGSVVVEHIFSIPGMGRLLLQAIYDKDKYVIMAVLMVTALLTVVNLLLVDLLYMKADPRVSLYEKSPAIGRTK